MPRPMPPLMQGVLTFLLTTAASLALFLVALLVAIAMDSEPVLYAATVVLALLLFVAMRMLARWAATRPHFGVFRRGFLLPFAGCLALFLGYNVSRLHTGCPLNWMALPLAALLTIAVLGGLWLGSRPGPAPTAP